MSDKFIHTPYSIPLFDSLFEFLLNFFGKILIFDRKISELRETHSFLFRQLVNYITAVEKVFSYNQLLIASLRFFHVSEEQNKFIITDIFIPIDVPG